MSLGFRLGPTRTISVCAVKCDFLTSYKFYNATKRCWNSKTSPLALSLHQDVRFLMLSDGSSCSNQMWTSPAIPFFNGNCVVEREKIFFRNFWRFSSKMANIIIPSQQTISHYDVSYTSIIHAMINIVRHFETLKHFCLSLEVCVKEERVHWNKEKSGGE